MTLQQVNEASPDEKGIILINIDGSNRRFIKTKLLKFLEKECGDVPHETKPLKVVAKLKVKRAKGRPRTAKKMLVKQAMGQHRRKPVIAMLPNGSKQTFASYADAARALNVDKGNIPKVIAGKYKHAGGIKFKLAKT